MPTGTGRTPLGAAYNPNYDPTLRFRPVAPGRYLAIVKMADPDPTTRWTKSVDKNGNEYIYGKPIAKLIEGDVAGRTVYGFLSTMLNDQGGSAAHDVIIAAGLSHRLIEAESHEDLCELVDEALGTEGIEMSVYIDWQAALKLNSGEFDYTDRVKGSKNFPKDEDGNPIHAFNKKDEEGEVIGQYVAQAEAKYFQAA